MKKIILCILIVLIAACSSTPVVSKNISSSVTKNISEEEKEAAFCAGVLYVAARYLAGESRYNEAEEIMDASDTFFSTFEGNSRIEDEAVRAHNLAKEYLYSNDVAKKKDFAENVSACIDAYNTRF